MSNSVKLKVKGKIYDMCPEDGHTLIDENHAELLKDRDLRWSQFGYAILQERCNGKVTQHRLNRYIVQVLMNQVIPEGAIVHHKNGDRFDNRSSNLEVTTYAHNAAAISRKNANTTSKFKGISLASEQNKWRVYIHFNKKNIHIGYFNSEYEAAKAYDRCFVAIHGSMSGSNALLNEAEYQHVMENKELFLPSMPKPKNRRELPTNITCEKGSYRVNIQRQHKRFLRRFKNLDEAVRYRDDVLRKLSPSPEKPVKIILRNEDGIAIIALRSSNPETVYTLVDDNMYFELIKYNWFLTFDGYAAIWGQKMHLLILPSVPGKMTDHINKNRLDNRKCNLRVVSIALNCRNRIKKEGATSMYPGVWKVNDKMWASRISNGGYRKNLGRFDNEKDAADAYQKEYSRLEALEWEDSQAVTG